MTISNPVHGVDVAEGNYDNQRHASLATTTHATSAPPPRKQQPLDIIDIRQNDLELDLRRDIMDMLKPERGPKKLPTLLLYDEKGLQTFEEVGESLAPHPLARCMFYSHCVFLHRSRTWRSTTSRTPRSTFWSTTPMK